MYLQKIQKVMNVFKILVTIYMVLTFIYAGCLIVVGATAVFCDGDPVLGKIGNVTIMMPVSGAIEHHGAVYFANGVASLFSAIILVGIANYLKQEHKDGTPFTEKGANMLMKLGITTIVLSGVSGIVQVSILAMYELEADSDVGNLAEFAVGICFIIFSMILRYGSQLESAKKPLASESQDRSENINA